jgi:hypothetical protein
MTPNDLLEKLLDVVVATELSEEPNKDWVATSFKMYALAISTLPRAEREAYLLAIEDGSLREAVKQFEPTQPPEDRWLQ